MQNYIAQRQVEMAGEKSSPVQSPAVVNGEQNQEDNAAKPEENDLGMFKNLSTLQMMDDLSRELVHWQQMIVEQREK